MQEKLALLVADPTPDAKVKKQLRHLDGKLHRLRSGDHRIFYTYDDHYVSVLALRRRKEDTYDEEIGAEFLGGLDPVITAKTRAQAATKWIEPAPSAPPRSARPLPTPITEALRKGGLKSPRILFTTYTNALVKFSQQLLTQLLDADAKLVDVRTADSLVREIAFAGHSELPLASDAQQRAQVQALARLSREYLLEELNTVLDARRLATLDAYLAAPRPGRQLALNATQRTAVWRVHQAYVAVLAKAGPCTWQQARAKAAAIVDPAKNSRDFRVSEVTAPYAQLIERVVRVERLREVAALVGFTRILSPSDLSESGDVPGKKRPPLARR